MSKLSIKFLYKKSSTKEAVIISNTNNFLWYFWKFYLFLIVNTIYNEQLSGIFYIRNSYASLIAIVATWGISLFSSKVISYSYSSNVTKILDIYKKLLYLLFIPIMIILPFVFLLSIMELIIYLDVLMLRIFLYLLIHGIFLALSSFYEGLQRFRFSVFFTFCKLLIDTIIITLALKFKNVYDMLFYIILFDFLLVLILLLSFNYQTKNILKMNSSNPQSLEIFSISNDDFFYQLKKDGLPIALLTILGIVSENVSRLFIGLFISESILSGYIFAISIILVLSRTTNGFSAGLVPRLTELNLNKDGKKTNRLMLSSCFINEMLLCIGAVTIYIFYEPFVSILFGLNFSKVTSQYINLLSISLIFFGFSGAFSGYFVSIGKSKYILYSSILSLISNILIILSLGPHIGIYAVILGFIVSRALIFYIIMILFLIWKNDKSFIINILLITFCVVIFFIFLILFSNLIQGLNQLILEKLILFLSSILILSSFYYTFKKLNPY